MRVKWQNLGNLLVLAAAGAGSGAVDHWWSGLEARRATNFHFRFLTDCQVKTQGDLPYKIVAKRWTCSKYLIVTIQRETVYCAQML